MESARERRYNMDDLMQKTLDDHEDRIRALEKNYPETKYSLINVEKGQSDLKLMITESNAQLSKILNKFVDSDIENKTVNRNNLWNLIFKIWVVVAPIIAIFRKGR
jgi:hypothetical protein